MYLSNSVSGAENHNQLLAAIRCGQCNFRSCSVEKLEKHKKTEHSKKKTLEETQTLGPKSKKLKTTDKYDSNFQNKVQNSENGPETVEKNIVKNPFFNKGKISNENDKENDLEHF